MSEWWKSAVGYQIYPRSFADANGDGVGDLPGIVSRLDHLVELGVGFIWLSPVFASPMADNGYDISDYRAIAPMFGTLADFDRLVAEARARGLRIVIDLVVNHSSDEHEWFRDAKLSRTAKYRDFYVWRDPAPDGGPPNDLHSFFGGPAWSLSPETGQYYLHLFHARQPDLNWANRALRAEVYDMMRWWLARGVAGFRMDVIDLIGKDPDARVLADGPHLHAYLQEMHREVLAGRDVVTVGEAWSATTDTARLYTGRDRGELSMLFQFSHVTAGWDQTFGKWRPRPRDLPALKRVFDSWQTALEGDGWNSLFWSNHDLPRAVSAYGDDGPEWRLRSAKALAMVLHLMRGTPYIYQGEEFGMTNAPRARLEDFDDVEIHGQWPEMRALGLTEAGFLAGANANGRDNARTPMQWDGTPGAGFTSGTPWLALNPNAAKINAEADRADPEGLFAHYARLIALRKTHAIIREGRHIPLLAEHPAVWAYVREHAGQRLTMAANLSATPLTVTLPPEATVTGTCLIANTAPRDALAGEIALAPWQALAVLGPA